MLDIARVQKLHEAAIAAGLPGVLPDPKYELRKHFMVYYTSKYRCSPVPDEATQAAVAWWLREWCIEHRGVDAFGDPEVRTDIEYLEWAEEIVANRKARPWAFR
jgi:hypothetical protein